MMTMKTPLGTDNFREIRERNRYYVDKTLLIKEFLDEEMKGVLITRPRRFGKTMNMTMLQEFFDLTTDSRSLFNGLNIMDTKYAKKINSTPVIFLTFKNCEADNQEDLLKAVAVEVVNEYHRYNKYFGSDLDEIELEYSRFRDTFRALNIKPKEKIDSFELQRSLEILIRAVHLFTGIKPMVLIDEYDQPIISAHESGFRESFSKIYATFLTDGLKSNKYLGQAMMTGIQRVAKESIFSKLNHFVNFSVLDEEYSLHFGLTVDETSKALKDFGLELDDEIKSYYDGYRFGSREIYNPWSIFSYIFKKKVKPYWRNTSTNALIKEAISSAKPDFFESFEELILNGEVEVEVELEASFVELANTETLWGLLVNSGYLTFSEDDEDIVRIPNFEAMKEFRAIVANYTNIEPNLLENLFKALVKKDMEKFLKYYKRIINRYVSCHDILENAYHMLLLGMSISVAGMYEIKSNIEEGDGRPDIFMKSLKPHLRPHVIFEMKQGDNVEKEKIKALEQIFDRKYYINLTGQILCVGVAHSKKDCDLTYKLITN